MPDCSRLAKPTSGLGAVWRARPTVPRRQSCRRIVALCAVLLTGCNVGPKYIKPAAPTAPSYKESAPAAYSAAPPGTWQPAKPEDATLKGKWWEIFNEPELNALEDQLNIDNQNIKQYFENFMTARALDRKSTRLNSSHERRSRMPSSA